MKIIFAYVIPCILLSTTIFTVLIGLAFFSETQQYYGNWIVAILIIVLIMMTITLRDWSLGKLPMLMLERMIVSRSELLRIRLSIFSGGVGAVTTYVIFSALIGRAFLPPLGDRTIYFGGLLGVLVLIAYMRGAYLFFSALDERILK